MSSNVSNNASARVIRHEHKDRMVRTIQTEKANKENVLSDLSVHLAVHAERMKLLKRAEEGLEKLSADPFISKTTDYGNEKDKLALTHVIAEKRDNEGKFSGKSVLLVSEAEKPDGTGKQSQQKKSKLPVSDARQRRRNKKDSTKSQIQIKNYRPGYTWNKGGRVKELRIRCLARKFLHIWKRKVFGRVMPSQARSHYHRHIMRQAFNEWYDMWWHVRKEWRLMVRAECHFRYLAWTKYFEAWKEFISYKKEDKRKMNIADKRLKYVQFDIIRDSPPSVDKNNNQTNSNAQNAFDVLMRKATTQANSRCLPNLMKQHQDLLVHYNGQILKKMLTTWKFSTSSQKQKHKKSEEAVQFYASSLLKRSWSVWKERYGLKEHRKNMGVIALQFWAYRLQVQHWLLWCEAFKRRQHLHNKEKLAVRHNKFYTMQKAMTAWISYTNIKKEKQAEKEYAQSLYHRSVLVRCMRVWVNQYNTRIMVQNHQAHIQDLGDRFTKRQYFQRWHYYIVLQNEKERKNDAAITHYCRKLKILGLSAFRLHLVQQKMKVMQTAMADNFYVNMLTKRYWNCWMARCEHNEELAIHSLTVKATLHYRMVIYRKLLDSWMDYVEWRKHRQAQYDKADAYYYVRAMPVFLRHMKAHVELQKRNREYAEIAIDFRRENQSARFFFMWYNNFEQSREDRMNKRMAILHYDGCLFKRFFGNWRIKYREALEDYRNQEQADEHFNIVLCRKHLKALKQYMDELKVGEINDARATKHHYLHKQSVAFKAWKQFVSNKRKQDVKKNMADMFYRRHVYQRVIRKLKNNMMQGRQFRQIADAQYTVKCQGLVRWALLKWKENCDEQKEEKRAEQLAVCHYHRSLLNKITTSWHRYAAIHAYKKSESRKWVENTQKILNHNKLERYFSFWKKSRDESLLYRLKREQATQHHNRDILQKLIIQWKQFVKISVKKKLLIKQCLWFDEVRLKTWAVSVWKEEHIKSQETVRKSSLALWHWSLTLQKQVLVTWYIYTQDRKRKKSRITQAIERRRTRLVRNGITQWLSVTNDLSGLRAKFAAQQHATKAFTLHQVVQKCALHWRHWTARRKSQHGPKTDLFVSTRSVPFRPSPVDQPFRQTVSISCKPSPVDQPVRYISVPMASASSVLSKELVPEKLVPMVSGSPSRSKGLIPEGVPSKHVEFKLDRNVPSRRKPRHPSFLADSLKRAGLFSGQQEYKELKPPEAERLIEQFPCAVNIELQTTGNDMETIPKTADLFPEASKYNISTISDKNYLEEEFHSNMTRTDQTSGITESANSGQTSCLIGAASTLQVRGFCDKLPTGERTQSETENLTQQTEKTLSSIISDGSMEKNYIVPKQGYKTFETKLLTPADFMASKMTSTLTKDAFGVFPNVGLSPRDRERIDDFSSINSTLKTKESVDLLSTGNESSKLKESSGFVRSADDTTPRSTDSLFPINISSPRSEKKGTVLANQITDIRNRLKGFNEKKKRVRKLQKQHLHLSDWLEQEVKKGEEVETEVIKKEIFEIEEEMRKLNQEIDIEKPMCAKLVSEVQILVKLLQGSETS